MPYDAIIIGGSYAGLSAALPLVRARRTVLVIDAGLRRNRFADASHGFFGQDGSDPSAMVADAKAQLLRYDTVEWRDGTAVSARASGRLFAVTTDSGDEFEARRLILATGVRDELPDVPGLAERWGRSVFHCPYCHGYELNQGRIGVLASSALSIHHALMLPDWGMTTFFVNDAFEPDEGQLAQLNERGVTLVYGKVARVEGERAAIVMTDGSAWPCDGLFVLAKTQVASLVAEQLGCRLEESPVGQFIWTDALKQTSIAGVFACGDGARGAGSVPLAVGDGALAGTSAHRTLMFGL
ncbi:NAD(P)/FAD-dependent oxidoreductase [Mesorhizobium microcysteis]|uniref:Thioredoxin reductase n=1 Tax=Neoaquamicrobium microcysteis TaxID=2682781 RepID=A0A5D4GUR7_9HYPH|nr:NAD(P)/FAD-dependent oxidoreductase [Mesorhizobium microcysteis]TYR31035.1 NAD(P)/FAD-dependent oxidoreductase [Mesorhizobium microcysteis]